MFPGLLLAWLVFHFQGESRFGARKKLWVSRFLGGKQDIFDVVSPRCLLSVHMCMLYVAAVRRVPVAYVSGGKCNGPSLCCVVPVGRMRNV